MDSNSAPLLKRYLCNCYGGVCYNDCSTWYDWGRWVALGAIVVGILLVALMFSCINNRRRRRRGVAPMYGTGWVPYQGGKPMQGQQNFYPNQPYNGGGVAAPPYSPPIGNQTTGNTYNSNDGYYGQQQYGQQPYGQQQHGFELQQPQSSYQPQVNRGGENVYEAPRGAPPGKGDGVVR